MTLSINKLQKLLSSKGMIIKKIYDISGLCVYIEIMYINNADTIMLYIPSKYEISSGGGDNVHKLHYLEINDDGTIPMNYAENPDDIEMENKYQEIDIDNSNNKDDIEKYLEESYNFPIELKDIDKNDINELKDIFRQLRRLKFCVQNLKYKLCIFYKYYVCCIRRDDTYECYSIENFSSNKKRNLVITIDLESLYSEINTITMDVKNIYRGIFHVLDRNQNKHVRKLQKMMEYKANFDFLSTGVIEQKIKYKNYLEKLEILLLNLLTSEKKIIDDITNIQENYANKKALYQDIEKSHLISKKEEELNNINQVKQDIICNILKVKSNLESLSLKVDQICFDNTVMLNTIIKNFEQLSKI